MLSIHLPVRGCRGLESVYLCPVCAPHVPKFLLLPNCGMT